MFKMFKNWHPNEVFLYVILPGCLLILLVLFGPRLCTAAKQDSQRVLFKQCVEKHPPESCRFLIEE